MSLAVAEQHFWHFYYLMPEPIALVEQQRDEARAGFLANPDSNEHATRLIKMEELLLLVRAGEFGQNDVSTGGDGWWRASLAPLRKMIS
jgi:hypothetical protein